MNVADYAETVPMAQVVGWTLIHFLWQGALIAAVLGAVIYALRDRTANARYAAGCVGMGLMLLAPFVTLLIILNTTARPAAEIAPELFLLELASQSLWDRLAPIMPYLAHFWLAGTCFLQVRMVLQWLNAQRLKRRFTRPVPAGLRIMVERLRRQLGIKPSVRILVSSLAVVPMAVGWIKPVVLLPASALTGLPPKQLKMIIAHELAHIRRHDYIVNLIQALFESLLFYHPAVWWLSNRLRIEREYCCDDVAVSAGRDALGYAKALSSLDALRDEECRVAVASTGGSLMNRIFRLVGVRSRPTCRLGGWLVPVVFAATMSAAVSAMTLSPAAALDGMDSGEKIVAKASEAGGKPEGAPPPPAKAKRFYVEKACAADVKDLIAKLRDAGKSDFSIQTALMAHYYKTVGADKNVQKKALRDTLLIENLEEMGYEGETIKKFLSEARKRDQMSSQDVELMDGLKEAYLEKYEAMGYSKKETNKALNELYLKKKKAQAAKAWEAEEKAIVADLRSQGKSDKEIKKTLTNIYTKQKKTEQLIMAAEKRADYVADLQQMGKSETEIRQALVDLEAKELAMAKKKKMKMQEDKDLQKKEQAIIDKMKQEGKSKEEIIKALEDFRKKVGMKKKKAKADI